MRLSVVRLSLPSSPRQTKNIERMSQHDPHPTRTFSTALKQRCHKATHSHRTMQGPLVGVLALQGAFEEHQKCLEAVGCRTIQVSSSNQVDRPCEQRRSCAHTLYTIASLPDRFELLKTWKTSMESSYLAVNPPPWV